MRIARPAADQHRPAYQHAPADAAQLAVASRLQPVIQAARHQIGLMVAKPIRRQPKAPHPNPVSAAAAPDEAAKQASAAPVETAAAPAPPKQSLSLAPSQPPEDPIEHNKGLVVSSADQHTQTYQQLNPPRQTAAAAPGCRPACRR